MSLASTFLYFLFVTWQAPDDSWHAKWYEYPTIEACGDDAEWIADKMKDEENIGIDCLELTTLMET